MARRPRYTIGQPSLPKGVRIANYYPLRPEELAALLAAAREAACAARYYSHRARAAERLAKRYRTIAQEKRDEVVDIHCRLTQAIPGMTYPHPTGNLVARRSSCLDGVFVAWTQAIGRSREPLRAEAIRQFEELLTGSGNPGSRTTWLRRLGLTP